MCSIKLHQIQTIQYPLSAHTQNTGEVLAPEWRQKHSTPSYTLRLLVLLAIFAVKVPAKGRVKCKQQWRIQTFRTYGQTGHFRLRVLGQFVRYGREVHILTDKTLIVSVNRIPENWFKQVVVWSDEVSDYHTWTVWNMWHK